MLCSCLLNITGAKKDMSTCSGSGIISVSGPEGGWERWRACLTCTMHACMTRWRDIAAQGPDTPAGLRNHFNYSENKQEQRSSSPGMTSVLICSPFLPVPPPRRVIVRCSLFCCDVSALLFLCLWTEFLLANRLRCVRYMRCISPALDARICAGVIVKAALASSEKILASSRDCSITSPIILSWHLHAGKMYIYLFDFFFNLVKENESPGCIQIRGKHGIHQYSDYRQKVFRSHGRIMVAGRGRGSDLRHQFFIVQFQENPAEANRADGT